MMHKKVIFLDVDGVLNHVKTRERTPSGYFGVDPDLVDLFRQIVLETDANIVLSSAWRNHPKECEYLWIEIGIDIKKKLLGKTIQSMSGFRGREIETWLSQNPTEKYIILDDNDDMTSDQLPNFLQTDPKTGLTETIVKEAILRLNGE